MNRWIMGGMIVKDRWVIGVLVVWALGCGVLHLPYAYHTIECSFYILYTPSMHVKHNGLLE
jgi:hypothetical protein